MRVVTVVDLTSFGYVHKFWGYSGMSEDVDKYWYHYFEHSRETRQRLHAAVNPVIRILDRLFELNFKLQRAIIVVFHSFLGVARPTVRGTFPPVFPSETSDRCSRVRLHFKPDLRGPYKCVKRHSGFNLFILLRVNNDRLHSDTLPVEQG